MLLAAAQSPCLADTAVGLPLQSATVTPTISGQTEKTAISVLERFRSYSGPRSPEALSALFDRPATTAVRQQPQIALSDGRTTVIIAVKIAAQDGKSINFTLDGATQTAVRKLKNDEWEIRALPDAGSVALVLHIMTGTVTSAYPLVVAPMLPAATDLSEQGFNNFLHAGQTTSVPGVNDLNRDGRYDYVDDFIFTANYLARQSIAGSSREARRQRALKRTLAAPNSAPPQPVANDRYDGVYYGEP